MKLRYPEAGDRVFVDEGGGRSSADLSATEFMEYVIGYRLAAVRLIEHLPNEPGAQGMFLGYPAIFLFRHYLELNLKHAISLAAEFNGTDVVPKRTHKLDVLWKQFREECGIELTPDVHAAESCILELSARDPASSKFRYPDGADSAGVPLGRVNMTVLADTITKVGNFIEAIIDQLQVDLERQAEFSPNHETGSRWE